MAAPGKARHIVVTAISIPVGVILVLVLVLLALSPGRPRPVRDDRGKVVPGSISEKIRVPINGVEQGMFIRGRDRANPVLLFLHGGTAFPEYFLARRYPDTLEQLFTVCWWERRGAGLSYSPDVPPETMTIEQSIADTLEVTRYLRARFHVDKIYLMGHSGGSLIAIQAAARAPELYAAYIGIAQMSYQLRSERMSWEYMLKAYEERGNVRMVRRLQAAEPGTSAPLPASYMALRDRAMHELGVGTTRGMRSVITGVFLASWTCPDYTLREKLDTWKGKFRGDRLLWNDMVATDLTRTVAKLDVPAYFFHGIYDYTVAYPLTHSYVDGLAAPVKGFYTFRESAHSPIYEEPLRTTEILREDVLTASTRLADAR